MADPHIVVFPDASQRLTIAKMRRKVDELRRQIAAVKRGPRFEASPEELRARRLYVATCQMHARNLDEEWRLHRQPPDVQDLLERARDAYRELARLMWGTLVADGRN